MWIIALKEFRELLYSPKFIFIFIAAAALIFISVFSGYVAYSAESEAALSAQRTGEEDMKEQELYRYLRYPVIRQPEKLSVFDAGISGYIGRKSFVTGTSFRPSLYDSRYSADPVLTLFGELDLTSTVVLILSLFAFLLSFNSVSGEREAGTLKMIMSGSISRSAVMVGKLIGGFVPLALLFIVPFLLSLTGLALFRNIGFSVGEWTKIALMALAYLLYLLLFYCMGMAASALTRSSFASFMLCLLIWVFSVAILPKLAVQAASQVSPSMSTSELESRRTAYWRQESYERDKAMAKFINSQKIKREDWRTKWIEFYDQFREESEKKRKEFLDRLYEDFERQRNRLSETAVSLARISPSSSLTFTIHGIANTGPMMQRIFMNDVLIFRRVFTQYVQDQSDQHKDEMEVLRQRRMYDIKPDASGFMRVTINESGPTSALDLSGIPRFNMSIPPIESVIEDAIIDFGVLIFFTFLFFAAAYMAFLRYDVRSD